MCRSAYSLLRTLLAVKALSSKSRRKLVRYTAHCSARVLLAHTDSQGNGGGQQNACTRTWPCMAIFLRKLRQWVSLTHGKIVFLFRITSQPWRSRIAYRCLCVCVCAFVRVYFFIIISPVCVNGRSPADGKFPAREAKYAALARP